MHNNKSRLTILFSLILIASMALAACASSGASQSPANSSSDNSSAVGTPSTSDTTTVGTPVTSDTTTAGTPMVSDTPTEAATSESSSSSSPTEMATGSAETPEATQASSGGIPVTGGTPGAPGTTPASAQVTLMVANNATLGSFLTDDKGRTLYAFTNDTGTSSSCTGNCATMWPPAAGAAMPGSGVDQSKIGSLSRSDGTTQITYNNHPLYYFSKDSNPGDINGQGYMNKWFVVSSTGDLIQTALTPNAPAMNSTPAAPSSGTPMSPSSTPGGG